VVRFSSILPPFDSPVSPEARVDRNKEFYGRQILFFITYMALTAFNAGATGSQNIETLITLRFFAGAFGSSPLTNCGGVIADMFTAEGMFRHASKKERKKTC